MSILGQQIKKYRMDKGITQEQLGQLVGVTTQAVSKWECGGTPDAELLPNLAAALGVSIDALFGKEEESPALSLARKLLAMPNDEAFRYAFSLCWATMVGLTADPIPDGFLKQHIDFENAYVEISATFGRIAHDAGIGIARMTPDFRHFFLMPEPRGGLSAHLNSLDKLCQVFEVFADKTALKVLVSMYTRLNTPVDTSLIEKLSGLPAADVERSLDALWRANLVKRTEIATASGEIYSYLFNRESTVVALLCLADELSRKEDEELLWSIKRTKPLFQSTPG